MSYEIGSAFCWLIAIALRGACLCRYTKHKTACRCTSERTLIIARLAIGDAHYTDTTLGDVRVPPARKHHFGEHDSIVANPGRMKKHAKGSQTHQGFVVFDTAQAYPCFIVQYTVSWCPYFDSVAMSCSLLRWHGKPTGCALEFNFGKGEALSLILARKML